MSGTTIVAQPQTNADSIVDAGSNNPWTQKATEGKIGNSNRNSMLKSFIVQILLCFRSALKLTLGFVYISKRGMLATIQHSVKIILNSL